MRPMIKSCNALSAITLAVSVLLFVGIAPAQAQPAAPPSYPSAEDIAIQWTVLANSVGDTGRSRGELAITNRGDTPLPARGWTLGELARADALF